MWLTCWNSVNRLRTCLTIGETTDIVDCRTRLRYCRSKKRCRCLTANETGSSAWWPRPTGPRWGLGAATRTLTAEFTRPPRLPAAQPPPAPEAAMTARPVAPVIPGASPGRNRQGNPGARRSVPLASPPGLPDVVYGFPHRRLGPGRRPGDHCRAGLAPP